MSLSSFSSCHLDPEGEIREEVRCLESHCVLSQWRMYEDWDESKADMAWEEYDRSVEA